MTDPLGSMVVAAVVVLLALGLVRQFTTLSGRWILADRLALLPQWKFFGQTRIARDDGVFDDLHLLVRRAENGQPGPWQDLFWRTERGALGWLWNGQARSSAAILTRLVALAAGTDDVPPTNLAYLTLLLYAIERTDLPAGATLQFALASTRGRGTRGPQVRFLSQWHQR